MRRTCLYISALLACFATVSCKRTATGDQEREVAAAGGKRLYESELAHLFTSPMAGEDSLTLVESYVDMWVKKQLKVREAEKVFSGTTEDIEKMVEEYRNSLLIHRLEQFYVDTKLDSLYDDRTIEEYYTVHRGEFLLDRPIVKGAAVKVPDSYRQKKELRELMKGGGEKYQDFIDTSLKNDFELHEFDSWTDLSHFMAVLPTSTEEAAMRIFSSRDVEEVRDGTDTWYVFVSDRLQAGDPTPLERVSELIQRVLFTQRRQEIIRNAEDSIYRAALENREVEINL